MKYAVMCGLLAWLAVVSGYAQDQLPGAEEVTTEADALRILNRLDSADIPEAEVTPVDDFEKDLFTTLVEQDQEPGTSAVEIVEGEVPPPVVTVGALVGNITDYYGRKLKHVSVTLFNDEYYREMKSTYRGNYGFSVPASNTYTLTASFENQFIYTNMVLVPTRSYFAPIRFIRPITVRGQLIMDGEPAQYGLFLRLVGRHGGQTGGIVLTNGYFRIRDLTPGRYTVICERRKRFIDRRINENRFYYFTVPFTNSTARITVERDRRKLEGHVILDSLPRRHVDALVILKDALTKGMLIHREAYTYPKDGYFTFNNVQPGVYILQATQAYREWKSKPVLVRIGPKVLRKRVTIDVATDPSAKERELENLKRQFRWKK
jgi:hypothetical protein